MGCARIIARVKLKVIMSGYWENDIWIFGR